jgi:molybdenum cofactor cytidylyltransferase
MISAIILAAGESSRFPGNKMTHELSIKGVKKPMIAHTVDAFLSISDIDEAIVVLGKDPCSIVEALEGGPRLKFVVNPKYKEGMSSSVKVGVEAVAKYADIVLIHPGDVPFISPESIEALLKRAKDLKRVGINSFVLVPVYGDKGGHPLLISKELIPEVLTIGEETRGLKGFLRKARSAGFVTNVYLNDIGVLFDIDTPEDLERARSLGLLDPQ